MHCYPTPRVNTKFTWKHESTTATYFAASKEKHICAPPAKHASRSLSDYHHHYHLIYDQSSDFAIKLNNNHNKKCNRMRTISHWMSMQIKPKRVSERFMKKTTTITVIINCAHAQHKCNVQCNKSVHSSENDVTMLGLWH